MGPYTDIAITPRVSCTESSINDYPRCFISNDQDVECAQTAMVKKVEEFEGPDDDAKDFESSISDSEYLDTPSYIDQEWEFQVQVDSEESVVVEHVFQFLDSYLLNDEEEDYKEEEIAVDVKCTIWTVYNEESNEWQHIVDGEPIIHKQDYLCQ